jgi:hypothetical protein
MNRKYKGGGCGCGGTAKLLRGGQNNNNNRNNNNSNSSNNSNNNTGLFGGALPMANVFLEKRKNGGGILQNIGSLFGFNNTSSTNSTPPMASSVQETNTYVEEPEIIATPPVKNSSLPDPASVVNKPVLEEVVEEQQEQPTGGKIINSLFGGYRATKRNRKYLRNYKKGKSIGFTMRSSLKAKGLIPRKNGTRRVSKKYRG